MAEQSPSGSGAAADHNVVLSPAVEPARFRHVLGHFCSGVAVITAMEGTFPVGFACQSFTALSLEPPLVSFSPARTSTTWPRIRRAGRFAVNVLAEDQEDLCRAFAVSGGDKFGGVDWSPSPTGSPVLGGGLAWIDCEVANEYEAGDHLIVVGSVVDLGVESDTLPLLFFRGGYGRMNP
jgi:3-hydroxy-9,10-secoandrosta-1,3,5(10)-triene-9,17-dione monooxygenase reductase component